MQVIKAIFYHSLLSPAGFSLQSYFGLQKSSTMDGTNTQVNLKVEDPANFMPPKIEITGIDAKRVPPRPHKLKPRDMNVLTPSGFWIQTSRVLTSSVVFICVVAHLLSCPPLFPLPPCTETERMENLSYTIISPAPETLPHCYSSQRTHSDGLQSCTSHLFQLIGPNKTSNQITAFVIPKDGTALYCYCSYVT